MKPVYSTHYERAIGFFGPFRKEAGKAVESRGPLAYFEALQAAGPRAFEDKSKFYQQDLAKRLGAINFAILENIAGKVKDPSAFFQVVNHPTMHAFIGMTRQMWVEGNPGGDEQFNASVLTNCVQTWQHVMHERAGKRVYEVSPGLAERLKNTELRGLKTDDLRMPYPSIYVTIPQSEQTSLRLYNEVTGWHPLEGFFLTEDAVGHDPANPVRTWRFMFCGLSHNPDDPFDDALFHFSVPLPPGVKVEDALSAEAQRIGEDTGSVSDPDTRKIFYEEWQKLFRWAMNVLMYITWPDIEAERIQANPEAQKLWNRIQKLSSGKKKDRLKEEYRKLDPMHRIRLGRSTPIWTPADRGEDATPNPAIRRVRTLVSGFWQRQVYGEGRALRRWRYQPPYWRNRDSEEESAPRHRLV